MSANGQCSVYLNLQWIGIGMTRDVIVSEAFIVKVFCQLPVMFLRKSSPGLPSICWQCWAENLYQEKSRMVRSLQMNELKVYLLHILDKNGT